MRAGVGSLLVMGLRGLRSRLLLTLGSVLLMGMAVAAAVVGPMYQDGAARSYLATEAGNQQNFNTGMTFDYIPQPGESTAHATATAIREVDARLPSQFTPAHAFVWSTITWAPGLRPPVGGQPTLAYVAGACAHVQLTGRCPTAANEVVMLRQDAKYLGLQIGQTIKPWGDARTLTLTGTYVPRASDLDFWFEAIRLQSTPADPTARIPPSPVNPKGGLPYRPAPFITPLSTFTQTHTDGWFIKVDKRLLVTPNITIADLQSAAHEASAAIRQNHLHFTATGPGSLQLEFGNALPSIARQVLLRRATARATVSPAVISVILVALVLLVRLLSAAMDLRRSELALASLRGFSRRQMWLLALIEPVLMVVIAFPIGAVAGYFSTRALARVWLIKGLPVPIGTASIVAALLVAVITLGVAAIVVRDAVNEPLTAQIAGVRRPTRATRWALILRLVLIAAAVAVLGATLARSGQRSPDATDLLLPILLATAAGLVTSIGAQFLARLWARWSNRRRGLFGYVASRTISRRREGTLVILPLTAALAVSIFAAGVYTSAASWRASDAATIVGADESYATNLPLGQAVSLTHKLDPQGKWLMAIGANYTGSGSRLVVDAPRLARVGLWPGTWTSGVPVSQVAKGLAPKRPSVLLSGSRLSMTVDNEVHGQYDVLGVEVSFIDDLGNSSSVVLGPFQQGISSRSVALTNCTHGCLVQDMSFGGAAALSEAMHGTVTISAMDVDAKPVANALSLPWRPTATAVNTPNPVTGPPRLSGGRMTVSFASSSANTFANITPTDVPAAIPVYWGLTDAPGAVRAPGAVSRVTTGSSGTLAVRSLGTTESMPILGPKGMLVDYTMFSRTATLVSSLTLVHILARSGTPSSVLAGLAAQGIAKPDTLAQTRSLLNQDAFALALNLYIVVTVIVILLAIAGLAANLAVQMPARRRDSASMRVVGMRRRSVVAAVVAEFVVVLGAAAIAGVAAGSLSQYVVVRTVTLGYADTEQTPRLIATFNLTNAIELLAALAVVLFAIGVSVAGLTVRGARTASLREDAR